MSEQNDEAVNRRREDSRTPKGRFGKQNHTAPEATLLTQAQVIDRIERSEARSEEYEAFTGTLKNAKAAARRYAYRQGLGAHTDDIVGDTIVHLLGQQKRETVDIHAAAFINKSARAITSRYHDTTAHHQTLKGRKVLKEREDAMVQELGRRLKPSEQKALVQEVLMSFPSGRRPVVGYQDKVNVSSLDIPIDEHEQTIADLIPAVERESVDPNSPLYKAVADLQDDDTAYNAADARKNAWNLVRGEAPAVAARSLNASQARRTRTSIKNAGGVQYALRQWENGTIDAATEKALFQPFGNPEFEDQERVVDTLLRNEKFAERLWAEALRGATRSAST